jgi:hypothetical protein
MNMVDEIPDGILPGLYDVRGPQKIIVKRNCRGRPRKIVDYERAKALAAEMCTQEEIALALGVSRTRLEGDPEFRAAFWAGRNQRKIGLRALQWRTAERGNVLMQIFLGKQYLAQTEKGDATGVPVVVVIDKKDGSL